MTWDEERIWTTLIPRRGRENAVSQHWLSEVTGIPARHVRQAIERLIVHHGKRICSDYSRDGGYYIPATDDEVEATCARLRGHAIKILQREAVLRRVTVQRLLADYQFTLFPEDDHAASR